MKDSLVEGLNERINHPFFGVYLIALIVSNFEAFVIIFFGNKDIFKSLSYVKEHLVGFDSLITIPILITITYIIANQWIMYVIDKLQYHPLMFRHEFKIEKENKESEIRKKLMKIEEEELEVKKDLNSAKQEVHKEDIKTYEKAKEHLSPNDMSNLKIEIDKMCIQKYTFNKLKSYLNMWSLGEFFFKHSSSNDQHNDFIENLKELIQILEEKCAFDNESDQMEIFSNPGFKEQIVSTVEKTYESYKRFNTYIQNNIL